MKYYIYFVLTAVMALSCSDKTARSPRPEAVEPSSATQGQETPVTIRGRDFWRDVKVSYADKGRSYLDSTFTARLGDTPLLEVTYVDDETLTARVGAGLPAGTYDLTVEDPAGRTGVLERAFTVVPETVSDGGPDSDIDADTDTDTDADTDLEPCTTDNDRDGHIDDACAGGDDCDDDCAVCWSGHAEICDGIDNDCDGQTDVNPATWWNTDWSFRRKLVFDNSGQDTGLDEVPVLVKLSEGLNFEHADAETDGIDLRFVDDTGPTVLAHHIENWNDASSDSWVWVRVPNIPRRSTGDYIWMYYGNSLAVDNQNEPGTFDDNYTGVWHFDEIAGAHVDSKNSISCDLLGNGDGIQNATGQIDGATAFDGKKDYLDCGGNPIPDSTYHTITAWLTPDFSSGSPDFQVLCYENTTAPNSGLGLYLRRSDGAIGKWLGSSVHYSSTYLLPDLTPTFVALVGYKHASAGWVKVSMNGGDWDPIIQDQDTSALAVVAGTDLVFGKWASGVGGKYLASGIFDEVRISNTERSIDWIRAQHLSGNNQFIDFMGKESPCP